jgi:hypothetical protein
LRQVLLTAFIAAVHVTAAMSASAQSPSPVRLLDIPYIQQSEALCGGAAAAMVMRYWGAPDVRAESFEALVDRSAGGIRAQDLLDDLARRGWRAQSFRGDAALVRARLEQRQPVVTLIEDRPGAYHFVVIAAWVNGRVVYHDPARSPFRVVAESVFDAAWATSDRWTMLLLPPEGTAASPPEPAASTAASGATACASLLEAGIAVAKGGDSAGALRIFGSAADVCPQDPGPHRETAGIYALEQRWGDAAIHARAAVQRDPRDQLAWQILAASEYVNGDPDAALDAWNAAGEPRIDLVTVQGLTRTRHSVAAALLALRPDTVLTSERLTAAGKRLEALPSADVAHVKYQPQPGGRANVEALVLERPLLPTSRGSLVMMGARALIDREVAATVSSPTGGGETIGMSWRWWEARERLAFTYAAPSALGVLTADVFSEGQTYGSGDAGFEETRRGGKITLANWTANLLRWEVATGLDVWDGERRTAMISVGADQRLADDRASLRGSVMLLGGAFSAWASRVDAAWRSRARHERFVWLVDGGLDLASTSSPRALWSGAGTGQGRAALLRAHPLLDNGRITSEVFGRRLYHASGEARVWMPPVRQLLRFAPAVFVDAARATRRLDTAGAWHADAGFGFRIAAGSSVVRVDVAKGLRDGATAFSVGWSR